MCMEVGVLGERDSGWEWGRMRKAVGKWPWGQEKQQKGRGSAQAGKGSRRGRAQTPHK